MPFFVELARDPHGNRLYTNSQPQVVEGDVLRGPNGAVIVFKSRSDIAKKWRSVILDGWLEVDGPARMLEWDEREALILAQTGAV